MIQWRLQNVLPSQQWHSSRAFLTVWVVDKTTKDTTARHYSVAGSQSLYTEVTFFSESRHVREEPQTIGIYTECLKNNDFLIYQFHLSDDYLEESVLQRCINSLGSFPNIVGLCGLPKKVILVPTLLLRFIYMNNLVYGALNLLCIELNIESWFQSRFL